MLKALSVLSRRTALTLFSLALSNVSVALAATGPAGSGQPFSMIAGMTTNPIAPDGTTAIMVTLLNADGSIFSAPVTVQFNSPCVSTGTASIDAAVVARNGIASSTYVPNGCVGTDQITARVGSGVTALQTVANVLITGTRSLSPKAILGRTLFFDKGLSAAGNLSCASCHSPAALWSQPDGLVIPLGGTSGTISGFRTTLSAAYAAVTPAFRPPGASANTGPRGGLMWDGRASGVLEQASGPFLGSHEMANAGSSAVLSRLLLRPYLNAFRAIYGPVGASSNPDQVLASIADAIASFEKTEKSFALFNSRYDAVQAGLATYTAQEARGQALFFNRDKGACAGCHDSHGSAQVTPGPQLFSDQSYRVLAVPRNWAIPYNDDTKAATALAAIGQSNLLNGATLGSPGHAFYDLGFCGPFRTDFSSSNALCGAFRVPSLRNVALKASYEHNGVFNSLAQVIDFYVNRDITPQKFYRRADGSPDIPYNDLPVIYQVNRDVRPPFTRVASGSRLSAGEMQDLIAFLCTLTDGFDPQHAQAYAQPAQCRAAVRP